MTRDFFNRQFTVMLAVFVYAQKMPDEGQDVYWEMLKDIPEEIFGEAVKKCLAECKFFPTIAELGDAAFPPKTRLSDERVWTKNGMDRLPVRVGWEEQIREFKRRGLPQTNQKRLGE